MPPLRLKACSLSSIDNISLKSMLGLAGDLLTHEWIIVDHGTADLCLYSLDTAESKIAWLQRGKGLTALLISGNNSDLETADIILKKPLRAKNFSEALNAIEKKIKLSNASEKIAKTTSTEKPAKTKQTKVKKPSLLTSLSSSISKVLTNKKSPAKDLPNLTLYLPEQNKTKPDTILDPALLKQWLDGLPEHDDDKIISSILSNILLLNRAVIPAKTRIALLDIYRQPISKLVFHRDMVAIKREIDSPTEFLRTVNALGLLLEELAIGYKIIINNAYQQGERPQSNDHFLIALNRATELNSLRILHAYRYYHSPPTNTIHELHQFYIYSEASEISHKTVSIKGIEINTSVYQLYCQIMLTGLADPYSLEKYAVFRLYNLMEKLTDKVEIKSLTNKQKKASFDFLMSGYFCIDCTADTLPKPLTKTAAEKRVLPQTRMLNTHGVLLAIEQSFIKASQAGHSVYDLDMQLLKKIIPQINTSYERKYHRLPSVKNRQINLANGVSAIQTCLNANKLTRTLEWSMINQGSNGMMASRDSEGCYQLNINELIGVFENNVQPKLATIRWLHTNNNDIVQIGLDIHLGHPIAISFTPEGETKSLKGLLLSADDDTKQPATLIVNKGIYSTNRVLHIVEGSEEYTISADKIINNAFNYEQFSFNITSKK
ncbi:MAG: hypothetical protein HRT93_01725 [Piscirickettsiaceae bacterium]|nr:hypothetical protein [Piscirickettsiaceae bacterium]